MSPLFDAITDWAQAQRFADETEENHRITLVHDAVGFARQRLAEVKRQRGLMGYDDMIRGVADALDGPQGEAFAAKLQAQYRVALLDEFQDTDARQWAIFRRLFASPPGDGASGGETPPRALFLIGDPKQAIYRFRGGDVFTYLAAARRAGAGQRHTLAQNFRSRPAMLAAVQALFDLAGAAAFAQDGITFTPVTAGAGSDDHHLCRGGEVMPALTVLVFDAARNIEAARTAAAQACVATIRDVLVGGAAGVITRNDKHGTARGVLPGDIAILVERHADGERMQRALSLAGIPSVAAGRQSLYDTDEARHLRWLLAALNDPGDDTRLRAALAAPLFGLDALAIAALDADDAAHRAWQDRLQRWRERAERHGPLALLNDLAAENAPRLLRLRDGERRLTNYLQLAEALQDAEAQSLGLPGLADELERRIADADNSNDSELLRLESDADRVKILTLHKSKGLEFDLVFLPFAATGGNSRFANTPPMATCHRDGQRITTLYPPKDGEERRQDADEEHAEDRRLLYVGLTRARLATWVAWGPAKDVEKTAFAALLHGEDAPGKIGKVTADSIAARLALLRTHAEALGGPQALAVVAAAAASTDVAALPVPTAPIPPAAVAQRPLNRDWWIYSFSQLAREDDGAQERGASDEVDAPSALPASRFAGARFGNSLHTALELVDMAAWRDCQTALPPAGQLEPIVRALREQGYASEADIDEGVPLLTSLVANTLNVRLPEGARLSELPAGARRAEMEFHLDLASTAVPEFLAQLHAHGLVSDRQAFGGRRRLEGLLTGFIDLVYEFDGRYYVLDYKSNQLRDYAPATLAQAVRDSEYDLQYVIYTLALHRWLRFRLGAAYDPARQLGGVRYLFCRGLDAFDPDSPGIHAPPTAGGLARIAGPPVHRADEGRRMSLLTDLYRGGWLRAVDHALGESLRRLRPDEPDAVLAAIALVQPRGGAGPQRLALVASGLSCCSISRPSAQCRPCRRWRTGWRCCALRTSWAQAVSRPTARRRCWRARRCRCGGIGATRRGWPRRSVRGLVDAPSWPRPTDAAQALLYAPPVAADRRPRHRQDHDRRARDGALRRGLPGAHRRHAAHRAGGADRQGRGAGRRVGARHPGRPRGRGHDFGGHGRAAAPRRPHPASPARLAPRQHRLPPRRRASAAGRPGDRR